MNVSSITSLINTFRKLSQKDSISPESLGHLLQQIVDALGSLVNDTDLANLKDWHTDLRDEFAVQSLSQSLSDRNEIHLNTAEINLGNGDRTTTSKALVIKQATTERAGAMRAQQVSDLNAAKKSVTTLETSVAELQELVSKLQPKVTALETEAKRLAGTADALHEEIDFRCGQLAEDLSVRCDEIDKGVNAARSVATDAKTSLDHVLDTKPWQTDIPVYTFGGLCYHTAEAGFDDIVYFCVSEKKFFFRNSENGNIQYNVPHNNQINGVFAPRMDAVYLLGNQWYHYTGAALIADDRSSEIEQLVERVAALEAKLK